MAKPRTPRKPKPSDIAGQPDPKAALDSDAFLKAAQPVLKQLGEGLLDRARGSPAVTEALEARHQAERAEKRTADDLATWQRALVDQVSAAWLLSCVFVRTLEDRGLLGHARLAGSGALDSQRLFFDMAPSLSERDYLLAVFRELSRLPAAVDLFDAKHNPVWMLAPPAEAAKALLALFRQPTAEEPTFRFGQADTRFLGDLYQDLNEDVQKRYALLQTPRFIESFILDRTLERAIDRFGLDDTTLIDPTCGSGHFLLGAFERLYDHRLRNEPALDVRQAAKKALDAVYGADINPYAVAIARFRLTLAFVDKGGYTKLEHVPKLPLHVVVADSLLHNPQVAQTSFKDIEGQSPQAWSGEEFKLEDEKAAREVLHRRYAAVVGNPPYITVKDPVLRERYRAAYISAAGKYSLAAPFAERFFQLAMPKGFAGMITANSFMKREFGKKLIEEYLRTVNLDFIANTSGAYIPGHGTPTVLLFGTNDEPQGNDILTVLANRGEPATPIPPEDGLVWRSIAEHWSEAEFQNNYISVARVPRIKLNKHPWSLGGGGAGELKELLERSDKKLGTIVEDIGFASFTGLDDAFIIPARLAVTQRFAAQFIRPMVIGESLRDWSTIAEEVAIVPYDEVTQEPVRIDPNTTWGRFLWRFRTVAQNVSSFGGRTRAQEGQNWWEWYRWQPERYRAPFRIAFAFVATHNHFVLDHGGKVFNRSAPIIKLPEAATEDDHLALLAYLNSSTACFWMKQVCTPKANHTAERPEKGIPDWDRYEFAGTALLQLPLPPAKYMTSFLDAAREQDKLSRLRSENSPDRLVDQSLCEGTTAQAVFQAGDATDREIERRMVCVQEDIDWISYAAMDLCNNALAVRMTDEARLTPDERPFLREMPPPHLNEHDAQLWCARRKAIQESSQLQLIENLVFKRKWLGGARGSFALRAMTYEERAQQSCQDWIAQQLENAIKDIRLPATAHDLWIKAVSVTPASLIDFSKNTEENDKSFMLGILLEDAVPYLATLRYSEPGLEKRATWEQTWALQRREDAGDNVDEIPVPRKYEREDYREPRFFNLRGKLDVPKERFISYPGCESDEDGEPVYGWAGWNHLEQAQALAALYQKRKVEEAWKADRLAPMLAGLLELLPWVKQWHNEPSEEYGGLRLGDYFETFLDSQCRELGLTREDLKAWRPPEKKRGARAGRKKAVAEDEGGA